jgi:hypothetical protein
MKRQSGILPSHLKVRILVLYMMSILSYLFDGLFSAFIFYGASGLPTWIVLVCIILFRTGYAELVSDKIMGIRHQLSLNNLVIASLGYGLPFFHISDRLNLTPFVIPLMQWFDGIMIFYQLQSGLRFIINLAFQALLMDFPRLILFIIITTFLENHHKYI